MASSAVFAATPKVGLVTISTANTNRDGSGTLGTVLTAGASGAKIEHIDVKATGTTTAGMVRIYIADTTPNIYLWREIPVSAITPSASVAAFFASIDCSLPENFLWLPASYTLRASTHNAESFNVVAAYGDI